MTGKFTLGKNERLKSRKLIEEIFSDGRRLHVPLFRVSYTMTGEPGLRLGVGVSSKQFKKASDRNRIKRLTRECYRLQKTPLQEKLRQQKKPLNIFLGFTGKEIPGYNEVKDAIGQIIKKLVQQIHEDPTTAA